MPKRRLADYQYEKERFIPQYELLKRLLLDEFSSMPPEQEFLPTQEELARRYGVSRNTVRRALAKLQRDGYIQTSTRIGSRILKRAVEAHRPVARRDNTDSCVGLLITNDDDDDFHKEGIRWQLVDEIERVFGARGVRLVVYNLRENRWQAWKDIDPLIRSMKANGIRWAAMRPNRDERFPWLKLLDALYENEIALTLYMQDTEEVMGFADFLRPGTGFTVVNNHVTLLEALRKMADDVDYLVYAANESAAFFADSRAQTCAEFARSRHIPFEYFKTAFFVEKERCRDFTGYADEKSVRMMLKRTGRCKKIFCVCANDEMGHSMHHRLRQLDADFSRFRFLGCDNNGFSKAADFSTIDFDSSARAKALYELYQDFVEGIRGRCSMTFSRLIIRGEKQI